MEGSRVIDSSDNSAEAQDISQKTAGKRPKNPSAKVLSNAEDPTQPIKQQKMVLNDELLTFVGEIIQCDPDAWKNILAYKRRKFGAQNKLIKYLSAHPNQRTHEKTSTTETKLQQLRRCGDHSRIRPIKPESPVEHPTAPAPQR